MGILLPAYLHSRSYGVSCVCVCEPPSHRLGAVLYRRTKADTRKVLTVITRLSVTEETTFKRNL